MSPQPQMHCLTQLQIDNNRKWIAWLRDPAHKQAKRAMTKVRPDGTQADCCLGGACKVMGVPVAGVSPEKTVFYADNPKLHSPHDVDLTRGAKAALGLYGSYGEFRPSAWQKHYDSLADMNDHGVKFAVIADVIERNLETNENGLFITQKEPVNVDEPRD